MSQQIDTSTQGERIFCGASIEGSKAPLWIIHVIRTSAGRVRFTPVRDQVDAGAKRRNGP